MDNKYTFCGRSTGDVRAFQAYELNSDSETYSGIFTAWNFRQHVQWHSADLWVWQNAWILLLPNIKQ